MKVKPEVLLGKFQSLINSLISLFKETGIMAELITWMVSEEGWKITKERFLRPLIGEFKKTLRSYEVDEGSVMVNLDAPVRLPDAGAKIEKKPRGTGWVKVSRVGDRLFIGEHEFILSFGEKQKSDCATGIDLRAEMEKDEQANVHPNVIDALIEEYPKLFPNNFKTDEQGRTRYISCWSAVF